MSHFGNYKFTDSVIHKLSSIDKVFSLFLLIATTFFLHQWWSIIIYLLIILLISKIAKVNIKIFIFNIKFFIYIMLITAFLELFCYQIGNVYFSLGILKITSGGINVAYFTFFKFLINITLIHLFLFSTSVLEISDSIYYILSPLKVFKFPVNDISLTISLALRFIPTMILELNNIKDAQKSRGNSFVTGSIKHRIKNFIYLLPPLFINTFKKANILASTMIVRGYTNGKNMTRLGKTNWDKIDTLNILIIFIIFIFIITKF